MKDAAPPEDRRVAAIVGGGGGIGRAIARAYGRRGWRLALIDVDADRLAAAAGDLAATFPVRAYVADAANDAQCSETMRRLIDDHGRLDALVHAAGLTHVSPFRATELDVVRHVMNVNFHGVVAATKAALDEIVARRGYIVVLSSVCGFSPLVGRTGYCASKHALHGFFDALRCEVARDGVSILLACPSFVATDFASRGLAGDGSRLSFERSTTVRPVDPEPLGEAIIRASLGGKRIFIPSWQGRLAFWMVRVAPRLYDRLMTRRFAVELTRSSPPPGGRGR